MERESREVDVAIVGAGPSGLSAAIRLAQLAAENDRELTICLLEKGSEVGAHILSGAVTPKSSNPLASTCRVTSINNNLANRSCSSAEINGCAL